MNFTSNTDYDFDFPTTEVNRHLNYYDTTHSYKNCYKESDLINFPNLNMHMIFNLCTKRRAALANISRHFRGLYSSNNHNILLNIHQSAPSRCLVNDILTNNDKDSPEHATALSAAESTNKHNKHRNSTALTNTCSNQDLIDFICNEVNLTPKHGANKSKQQSKKNKKKRKPLLLFEENNDVVDDKKPPGNTEPLGSYHVEKTYVSNNDKLTSTQTQTCQEHNADEESEHELKVNSEYSPIDSSKQNEELKILQEPLHVEKSTTDNIEVTNSISVTTVAKINHIDLNQGVKLSVNVKKNASNLEESINDKNLICSGYAEQIGSTSTNLTFRTQHNKCDAINEENTKINVLSSMTDETHEASDNLVSENHKTTSYAKVAYGNSTVDLKHNHDRSMDLSNQLAAAKSPDLLKESHVVDEASGEPDKNVDQLISNRLCRYLAFVQDFTNSEGVLSIDKLITFFTEEINILGLTHCHEAILSEVLTCYIKNTCNDYVDSLGLFQKFTTIYTNIADHNITEDTFDELCQSLLSDWQVQLPDYSKFGKRLDVYEKYCLLCFSIGILMLRYSKTRVTYIEYSDYLRVFALQVFMYIANCIHDSVSRVNVFFLARKFAYYQKLLVSRGFTESAIKTTEGILSNVAADLLSADNRIGHMLNSANVESADFVLKQLIEMQFLLPQLVSSRKIICTLSDDGHFSAKVLSNRMEESFFLTYRPMLLTSLKSVYIMLLKNINAANEVVNIYDQRFIDTMYKTLIMRQPPNQDDDEFVNLGGNSVLSFSSYYIPNILNQHNPKNYSKPLDMYTLVPDRYYNSSLKLAKNSISPMCVVLRSYHYSDTWRLFHLLEDFLNETRNE